MLAIERRKAMVKLSEVIFYSPSWDGPTKGVIAYQGNFYEVRSSWGEREGWTNAHGAERLTDEEVENADMLEMSDEEVEESYDEDEIEGMLEAVVREV
jgi:hypothetical protein